MIQKHSEFKVFYTHPEVIEERLLYPPIVSTTVLPSNIPSELSMCYRKIIETEASVGRSCVKEVAQKSSKFSTYVECDICYGCFSREFPKIFRTALSKSNRISMQWVLSKKRMGYSKT